MTFFNDAKDVVTSKVDKIDILNILTDAKRRCVDIKRTAKTALYIFIYYLKQKEKGGSLIICIQYCDILF